MQIIIISVYFFLLRICQIKQGTTLTYLKTYSNKHTLPSDIILELNAFNRVADPELFVYKSIN